MVQKTTEEFAHRLRSAVEGHPLAPPTPHGRQRWLLDKLIKEQGVEVSPNTVNKWFRGVARPREDKIRSISRVLAVDEVWLALGGKQHVANKSKSKVEDAKAQASAGPVLLLAGLLEMSGVRVSFPGKDEEGVSLWINHEGERTGITVATATDAPGERTFQVPEPAGDNRIVAVSTRQSGGSTLIDILDLTGLDRLRVGGFSVIQTTLRKDGKVKVEGRKNLIAPVGSPVDLL